MEKKKKPISHLFWLCHHSLTPDAAECLYKNASNERNSQHFCFEAVVKKDALKKGF